MKKPSLLGLYARPSQIFVKGNGLNLIDTLGKSYLDFTAGIAVNALGHNDPNVVKIISEQAGKLIHLSNLYHNEYQEGLADMIVDSLGKTSFGDDARVFFCNSGTEANEGAFKFARKFSKSYFPDKDKFGIVSFTGGFHGRTMGALSATANPKYQNPYLPLVPGFKTLPFNDVSALDDIDESVSAVILEPLQGEGGVNIATPQFYNALRKKCDEVGALFIADEIQCGIGRTGKMFCFEHFDHSPDMITLAKPLANGLPLGAVILKGKIANVMKPGDHGTTFGGSPLTTRVGQYVWKTVQEPRFLEHVTEMGNYIRSKGQILTKTSPLVEKIKGKGLLMGVKLRESVSTEQFVQLCRDRGLLVVSAADNTIRIVPALTVTKSDIEKAFKIFESVVATMEGMIASGH